MLTPARFSEIKRRGRVECLIDMIEEFSFIRDGTDLAPLMRGLEISIQDLDEAIEGREFCNRTRELLEEVKEIGIDYA